MNQTNHEFALYWPYISSKVEQYPTHALLQIDDQDLVHRMVRVLRVKPEDRVIFFDRNIHVFTEIGLISKNQVTIKINAIEKNILLMPFITFALPLLKREAFEEALYSLTEIGANAIHPVITKKVHRAEWSTKEAERTERIIIAAAEQSKQFIVPTIASPVLFEKFLTQVQGYSHKFFFDPEGISVPELLKTIMPSDAKILLMIGPEGDLTHEEKELLRKSKFTCVSLTPTVLRSQQAAAVGLGIFRAISRL